MTGFYRQITGVLLHRDICVLHRRAESPPCSALRAKIWSTIAAEIQRPARGVDLSCPPTPSLFHHLRPTPSISRGSQFCLELFLLALVGPLDHPIDVLHPLLSLQEVELHTTLRDGGPLHSLVALFLLLLRMDQSTCDMTWLRCTL